MWLLWQRGLEPHRSGREHVWKGQWQFDTSYRLLNRGYVATSDIRWCCCCQTIKGRIWLNFQIGAERAPGRGSQLGGHRTTQGENLLRSLRVCGLCSSLAPSRGSTSQPRHSYLEKILFLQSVILPVFPFLSSFFSLSAKVVEKVI